MCQTACISRKLRREERVLRERNVEEENNENGKRSHQWNYTLWKSVILDAEFWFFSASELWNSLSLWLLSLSSCHKMIPTQVIFQEYNLSCCTMSSKTKWQLTKFAFYVIIQFAAQTLGERIFWMWYNRYQWYQSRGHISRPEPAMTFVRFR